MKKIFTMLLAFFAFSLSVLAGAPGVTFLLKNGNKVSFTLNERPIVAFNDTDLAINIKGVKLVSYAYAEVQRIVIEDNIVSAIGSVGTNDNMRHVVFNLSNNMLSVSGVSTNEQVALYTTDGKLILCDKTNNEGCATINLSDLQQGVYVVRTQGGICYKLYKK